MVNINILMDEESPIQDRKMKTLLRRPMSQMRQNALLKYAGFQFHLFIIILFIYILFVLFFGDTIWTILVPQITFQLTVIKIFFSYQCEEDFNNLTKSFSTIKKKLSSWFFFFGSLDIKGSSWDQRLMKNLYFVCKIDKNMLYSKLAH